MLDDLINLLTRLTPIAALIAAILAWVAKIRWAKEYQQLNEKRVKDVEKNADERIKAATALADANAATKIAAADAKAATAESKALAAQDLADFAEKRFKALTDFGPEEIKKYFEGVISLDRQKITELQDLLQKANMEMQEKIQEINRLKEEAYRNREVIDNKEKALAEMRKEKSYLQGKLQEMEKRIEENDMVLRVINRPEFDMVAVRNMLEHYERERRWILSPTRYAYAQRQAERHTKTQEVRERLANIDAEEEVSDRARQHMKMNFD